jgi:hypothetical protein
VTVLLQLTGVLLSFTAVVAVQILAAYRTQLDRSVNREDVESRRANALWLIRMAMSFLIIVVLSGVFMLAWLSPTLTGLPIFFGLFLVLYSLLAGTVGLFLTVEEI